MRRAEEISPRDKSARAAKVSASACARLIVSNVREQLQCALLVDLFEISLRLAHIEGLGFLER